MIYIVKNKCYPADFYLEKKNQLGSFLLVTSPLNCAAQGCELFFLASYVGHARESLRTTTVVRANK